METTREKNIEGLNHLITIATDGQHGYASAAEHAKDPVLKAEFVKYAAERAGFAFELRNIVIENGGEPDSGGGPIGALHRAWINIKTAVASDDNKAVLNECITGDKAAVAAYETELKETYLSTDQRQQLEQQLKLTKDALFSVETALQRLV